MSEYIPTVLTLPREGDKPAPLAVEILPHGLTIHRFLVHANSQVHDIVIGPEEPQDHEYQKYMNSVIGRYTNRIPAGNHVIERRGASSHFTAPPNENSRVSLHGGYHGFDTHEWQALTSCSDAELFAETEVEEISKLPSFTYAIFRTESADGDQGYPGKLVVEAFMAILPVGKEEAGLIPKQVKIGSFVIIYRARLCERNEKAVTPINLTQHWGFTLEASRRPETTSVKDHRLIIRADKVAELNEDKLPTGDFVNITEDSVHLHGGKKIFDRFPDEGYDDYYLFEGLEHFPPSSYSLDEFNQDFNLVANILYPERSSVPVVELASDLSGIRLCFQTNQHGVMFYSHNFPDVSRARKKIHGGSGIREDSDPYHPASAVFLEFHNPLASFLFPSNKDKQDTLLTSEEIYHNYVRCDIYSESLPDE